MGLLPKVSKNHWVGGVGRTYREGLDCSGSLLFADVGAGSVVVDVLFSGVWCVGAASLVSGLLVGSFAMGLDPVVSALTDLKYEVIGFADEVPICLVVDLLPDLASGLTDGLEVDAEIVAWAGSKEVCTSSDFKYSSVIGSLGW